MKSVLMAIAALFGILPGIGVLKSGVWVPPQQTTLFGIALEVIGVATLLLLFANKGKIGSWTSARVNLVAGGLLALCFALVVVYYTLFDRCVVSATRPEWQGLPPVFFPISIEGDIAIAVAEKGSRAAVVDEYGPGEIARQLNAAPGSDGARWLTIVVMVTVYSLMVTCLTIMFGVLGLRQPASSSN